MIIFIFFHEFWKVAQNEAPIETISSKDDEDEESKKTREKKVERKRLLEEMREKQKASQVSFRFFSNFLLGRNS